MAPDKFRLSPMDVTCLAASFLIYVVLCSSLHLAVITGGFEMTGSEHAWAMTLLVVEVATRILPAGIVFPPFAPKKLLSCLATGIAAAVSMDVALVLSQDILPAIWGDMQLSRNDLQYLEFTAIANMFFVGIPLCAIRLAQRIDLWNKITGSRIWI